MDCFRRVSFPLDFVCSTKVKCTIYDRKINAFVQSKIKLKNHKVVYQLRSCNMRKAVDQSIKTYPGTDKQKMADNNEKYELHTE